MFENDTERRPGFAHAVRRRDPAGSDSMGKGGYGRDAELRRLGRLCPPYAQTKVAGTSPATT
jgi:hypothetical protein